MSDEDTPGPILTAASCDWEDCPTDVRADYLATNWGEAARAHARDLVAAGWRIKGPFYYCPLHDDADTGTDTLT